MLFCYFATHQECRHHRHDHLRLHLRHPGRVNDELIVANAWGSQNSEERLFRFGLFAYISFQFLQKEVLDEESLTTTVSASTYPVVDFSLESLLVDGRVEVIGDRLLLLNQLVVLSVKESDGGQDGPLGVNKLEHGLGADLEDDPGPVPLGGVVNDHGEAEVEIVPSEAPGEVRQRPGGHLGVHSGALDQERGQEVDGGGLSKAEVGLRSPVDSEDVAARVRGTDLK